MKMHYGTVHAITVIMASLNDNECFVVRSVEQNIHNQILFTVVYFDIAKVVTSFVQFQGKQLLIDFSK